MAAFLMVATTQASMKEVEKRQKGSYPSSIISHDSTILGRLSTAASSYSGSSSHSSKKNHEADKKTNFATRTYFEQVNKLMKTKNSHLIKRLNERMAISSLDTTSDHLFSKRNLEMLRYNYFEDFNFNYQEVHHAIVHNNLNYLKTIVEMDKREVPKSTSETNLNNKSREKEFTKSSDSSQTKYIAEEYHEDQIHEKQSIQNILHSPQFWNSAYQDLKHEYSQEFEYLPSITKTQSFFIEVIDFFLLHILELDGENSKDKDHFVYFKDVDFEWFRKMSKENQQIYNSQSKYSNNTPIERPLLLQVFTALLKSINENLKVFLINLGQNKEYRYMQVKLTNFWKEFLDFLFYDFICDSMYNDANNEFTIKKTQGRTIESSTHNKNDPQFEVTSRRSKSSQSSKDSSKSEQSKASTKSAKGIKSSITSGLFSKLKNHSIKL